MKYLSAIKYLKNAEPYFIVQAGFKLIHYITQVGLELMTTLLSQSLKD